MSVTRPSTVVRVAHQNALVESGIRYILGKRPGFDVLPPTGAGSTSAPCADVHILDYESGLRWARDSAEPGRAMVVAVPGQELGVCSALKAGILGYAVFGCSEDDIANGVQAVAGGCRFLCSSAALRMADSMLQSALTSREDQVLQLVSRGQNNKEVARALGIEVGTVKSHMRALMSKLDARCRTQAMWVASQRGLLPPSSADGAVAWRGPRAAANGQRHAA